MNRLIPALALLFTLALAGCDAAGPSAVEDAQVAPVATSADAATVVRVNERFEDLAVAVFVPCANGGAGELVSGTGDIHLVGRLITNANGVHFGGHVNFSGVSGTGIVTGDGYVGQAVLNAQLNLSFNGATEATGTLSFRAIGQGSAPNFTAHGNLHLTINANGEVTATVANFTADCD